VLDLRRLRLLRELRARGAIAADAEALSYSPSAVSQQLAKLQRETGVVLVERAGRRLRLTDATEVLAGHATALLERAEQAEAELAATAGGRVAGTVRIASVQNRDDQSPARTARGARRVHPGLHVEVVELGDAPALRALALPDSARLTEPRDAAGSTTGDLDPRVLELIGNSVRRAPRRRAHRPRRCRRPAPALGDGAGRGAPARARCAARAPRPR